MGAPAQPSRLGCQAAVLCLLACMAVDAVEQVLARRAPTIHTVVPTECSTYFTWQSLGIYYTWRKTQQPGAFTRIVSCTDEQSSWYAKEMQIVPSIRVESLTEDPEHNDIYSAYNKPGAVVFWLREVQPTEDFVLVIDADMIMRKAFDPLALGVGRGWAVSAFFSYMKGVNNELALKYIPTTEPRDDTFAGPKGRRADQVGGFTLMKRTDLEAVAPLWLKVTREVRNDPDAWNLTGDSYAIHPGDKPWISEMYGYSFGCAMADVWHKVDYSAMLYPGYFTTVPPKVLHYGLKYEVAGTEYAFDKHWHYHFDATLCPPWDMDTEMPKGGLFMHPPAPSTLTTEGEELLRDLLAIEVNVALNAAFCERHLAVCPPSEQLKTECAKAALLEEEHTATMAALLKELATVRCKDHEPRCEKWAQAGECESNPGYMMSTCGRACGNCGKSQPDTDLSAASMPEEGDAADDLLEEAEQDADSEELATAEEATTEDELEELPSAQQQPDSPTAVQGTDSAGSNAPAGVDIAASQSSAGTQPQSPAGTLQAQRQSSPTSALDKDAPLNKPNEVSSPSKTGNSSTGSRQRPEREGVLSEARSASSNRDPGRLADAHQAARLRGGNHDAAQLQQQQQRSDAELDPEHDFPQDLQLRGDQITAPGLRQGTSQKLELGRMPLHIVKPQKPVMGGRSGLRRFVHSLGWLSFYFWCAVLLALVVCLPQHHRFAALRRRIFRRSSPGLSSNGSKGA